MPDSVLCFDKSMKIILSRTVLCSLSVSSLEFTTRGYLNISVFSAFREQFFRTYLPLGSRLDSLAIHLAVLKEDNGRNIRDICPDERVKTRIHLFQKRLLP